MTLGQKLHESGCRILVIGNVEIESLITRLAELGFDFAEMDAVEKSNQESDAEVTQEILDRFSVTPDWLIVDHYKLDETWEKKFRNGNTRIMVIDDLANRRHACDLLIDSGYCDGFDKRYRGRLLEMSLQALGPKYAILRKEFTALRKRNCLSPQVKRIFVSYGGTDPTGETVKAMAVARKNQTVKFDIVVSEQRQIDDMKAEFGDLRNVTYHVQTDQIAQLLSDSDMSLGAGGTTTWERLCLGVPSIVTTVADNQEHSISVLSREGVLHWIGNHKSVDSDKLANGVAELLNDREKREQFLNRGQAIVDGCGADRIMRLMNAIQIGIELRIANSSDCDLYFHWANDPMVRSQSFQSEDIPYDDHCTWFKNRISDSDTTMLIGCFGNDPVGQVRLEKKEENILLSYSIAADFRGRSLAPVLLNKAISRFRERSNLKIHAETGFDNEASANALYCVGFCEITNPTDDRRIFVQG